MLTQQRHERCRQQEQDAVEQVRPVKDGAGAGCVPGNGVERRVLSDDVFKTHQSHVAVGVEQRAVQQRFELQGPDCGIDRQCDAETYNCLQNRKPGGHVRLDWRK